MNLEIIFCKYVPLGLADVHANFILICAVVRVSIYSGPDRQRNRQSDTNSILYIGLGLGYVLESYPLQIIPKYQFCSFILCYFELLIIL